MNFIKKHPVFFFEVIGLLLFASDFILVGVLNYEGMLIGSIGFLALLIMILAPIIYVYFKILGQNNNIPEHMEFELDCMKKMTKEEIDRITALYYLCKEISNKNEEVINNAKIILEDPKLYFNVNKHKLLDNGFKKYTNDKEMQWLFILNLLVKYNYAFSINIYKYNLDEFINKLKTLDNSIGFNYDNLKKEDELDQWIKDINYIWMKNDTYIGLMNKNSNECLIFVTSEERLQYLNYLSDFIGHDIYTIMEGESNEQEG